MSEKEVARSEPIKATSSVFKCVVHITKQCEVLLYAKDSENAIEQAEALTEQELADYGDCFEQHNPKVVKCEVAT
jgi:K+/H+ antiporter YhaU regulatory subunit KhtT